LDGLDSPPNLTHFFPLTLSLSPIGSFSHTLNTKPKQAHEIPFVSFTSRVKDTQRTCMFSIGPLLRIPMIPTGTTKRNERKKNREVLL
jgi:hypothetical protein